MSAADPTASHGLPVAGAAQARREALRLLREDARGFGGTLVLDALATLVGLVGPWLVGRIVDTVEAGGGVGRVDRLALLIVLCALLQTVLTRYARYLGARFGERLAARVRERFLDRVLALRPAVLERVSTGDLAARGTGDVATVSTTMRDAGPDVLVAATQTLFVLVAVLVVNPLLGVCGVVGLLGVWFGSRWYLPRARAAYLALGAANSALAESLVATAAGARTVEALGLRERRIQASDAAIAACREQRLRALALRSVLYPVIDVSAVLPLAAVLLAGGVLYDNGAIGLGAVVAATLYLRQLSGPVETLEIWIDQLQSSGASFARLAGLDGLPTARPADPATPAGDRIAVEGVHYAYEEGAREVLHGVDLTVRPGERLAIVGRSGAGKSTLGRLIAGIDAPRRGTVRVGGASVSHLSPEELRRQIVLVTQEHHVFRAPLRDNLLIARPSAEDAELRAALAAVGARLLDELPDGLDTVLGPGRYPLDGARAQQLALARVVLADPHTLVLDEATALLDPTAARDTERALSAVLAGRTVVAIAHRLQTAHDADRVAVMEAGRLTEIGPHDELVAAGGAYADLWHSWHGEPPERDDGR